MRLARELRLAEGWLLELDVLSRVYLVTRYPGEAADDEPPFGIDEQAATEYTVVAGKVVEWVKKQLSTS